MKRLIIRFFIIITIVGIILFIFLSMAGCAGISGDIKNMDTVNHPNGMSSLVDVIQAEMQAKNITGLSIAVADSEGLLWTKGFGIADKKNGTSFTDATISNVGSVSKLVTATAIMRLAEKKAIDLDAPVSAYIPEFNPYGLNLPDRPITVRMLLNHESGLESDGFRDFFLGYETPDDFPHSYRRAVEAVNQSRIVRQPYEIFSYCNLGYSLLGIIIERAHGGNFHDAVKDLVFDPIGMDDSTFNKDEVPEGKMAMGYSAGKPEEQPYIRDMPAGSLNSTANDMGTFLHSMLASYRSDDGLLHSETVKEMFAPSNTDVSADLDFKIGLTWWVVDFEKLPGEYIVGHGGDLPPYHAMVLVLPERDLSVFIMVNSVDGTGSFSLADIAAETVRAFTELRNQAPVAKASGISPVVEIPAGIKEDLPGYYASPVGLSEIKVSGDKLKIYTFNRWFDVHYHTDNTLSLGIKLMGIVSLKMPVFDEISISLEDIEDAQSINLRLQGILISPALKIEPGAIDPSWVARCGRYEAVQPEVMPQYTDFKIEMDKKSGFLCLSVKSGGEWSKYPLETRDSMHAQLMGTGRGLGGIVRATAYETGETLRFLNFELVKK